MNEPYKTDKLLIPGWYCTEALDTIVEGIQVIDFD